MNVVYASDDNYAEILGVSLISLFENNQEAQTITVYILDDKISQKSKDKLNSIFEKYGRVGIFIAIPDLNQLAGIEIDSQRWSISTFSRLFMAELLDESVEKILYIDCDTLVESSLKELWETDLEGYSAAGVLDCMSKGHKKNVGLAPDESYINAGILLINLKDWREQGMQKKFIEFIVRYGGKTPYVDQGVINGVLSSSIRILPPQYNTMTVFYDFTYQNMLRYRKPNAYYSEEEIEQAVKNPVIVHFTSSFLSLRPWIQGSSHPQTAQWLRYKALSPWKEVPAREDRRGKLKRAYERFYHIMPLGFSVWVSSLLHSTFLPIVQRHK